MGDLPRFVTRLRSQYSEHRGPPDEEEHHDEEKGAHDIPNDIEAEPSRPPMETPPLCPITELVQTLPSEDSDEPLSREATERLMRALREASQADSRGKAPMEYDTNKEKYTPPPPAVGTSRLEPLPAPSPKYTPPNFVPDREWGEDIDIYYANLRQKLAELRAGVNTIEEDEYGSGYYGDYESDDDEDQEIPDVEYEEEEDPEEDPDIEEEDPEEDTDIEEEDSEEYSSYVTDVGSDGAASDA